MFLWLWQNRIRPSIGSRSWYKTWAKRCYTAPRLISSELKIAHLAGRGAHIKSPVFLAPCVFNGKINNLKIDNGSYIGRIEFHLHDLISIGQNVIINDGVKLLTGSHDINDPKFALIPRSIKIGNFVWIAVGAIILPGVTIGDGAVVGAGAVVTKDVSPYSVVVGNPAIDIGKMRNRNLCYHPLRTLATIEAWIGQL